MTLLNFAKRIIFLFLVSGILVSCSDSLFIFENLEGPKVRTQIFEPARDGPEQYDEGGNSRLAILIVEDDSHWLALASGLKTIGIPFRMTKDIETALKHETVMVYPQITGLNLKPDELNKLRDHVSGGGVLIGTNVLGGGLFDVFGFDTITENKSRYLLQFQNGFVETDGFKNRGLSQVKIGSANDTSANPGTNSYTNPKNPPLAIYGNGEAAIIANTYGDGKSYALGFDLGQLLAKGYNRRQVDITEYYANQYQPTLDACLIFFENMYKNTSHPRGTLSTVPDGKSMSFMLTYDIDFSESLENTIAYAQHQKSEDIAGTFFIQTKYVRDYNDKIFMNDRAGELIEELDDLGAEIASHSVAHSNVMWDFEMGDGTESYPDYRPFVQTAERTRGATILGELRVSKFLLDNFTSDQKVDSFRPGYLSNPSQMPQALASANYKFSSSATANISLTHLPFQLSYDRAFTSFTPVFEIPITIEDELDGPMIERLDSSVKIARQIAQIGGTYVVLIHTDKVDTRLDFQKALVDEVKPYAWMGTMREFGRWWSARDQVSLDIEPLDDGGFKVTLDAPTPIKGLSLELNGNYQVRNSSLSLESLKREGNTILIDDLQGTQTIEFAI